MKDQEILELVEDLKSVGLVSPLSRFGEDLDDVVEITGGRYRKGTRAFLDPRTGARYSSRDNGYVRRYVPTYYWRDINLPLTSCYYLNPRRNEEVLYVNGGKYIRKKTVLLMEEEERLELVARAIRNYRKTLRK
jgi:hypothetical protein